MDPTFSPRREPLGLGGGTEPPEVPGVPGAGTEGGVGFAAWGWAGGGVGLAGAGAAAGAGCWATGAGGSLAGAAVGFGTGTGTGFVGMELTWAGGFSADGD